MDGKVTERQDSKSKVAIQPTGISFPKHLCHLRRFASDQVDIATVKTMEEYQNAATNWLINYWEGTLKSLRERMEKGEEEPKKLKDGTYWDDYFNNKQKMQDLIDGYLSGRN